MRRAEPLEALRPITDAFRRGTRRAKLRQFVVVCKEGHALVEVFPTASGSVAVWTGQERINSKTGKSHAGWTDAVQAEYVSGNALPALASCRCHGTVDVDLAWVAAQLRTGRRRRLAPALDSAPEMTIEPEHASALSLEDVAAELDL